MQSISGKIVISADGVFANEVEAVVQATLAKSVGVHISLIDVRVVATRRLSDRRLAGTWKVGYTIRVPPSNAAAATAAAEQIATDSTDFSKKLKEGLVYVVQSSGQSPAVIYASFAINDFSMTVGAPITTTHTTTAAITSPPAAKGDGWICAVCKHEYDPAKDGAGKAFEALADSWKCPVCGQPKSAYKKAAPTAAAKQTATTGRAVLPNGPGGASLAANLYANPALVVIMLILGATSHGI